MTNGGRAAAAAQPPVQRMAGWMVAPAAARRLRRTQAATRGAEPPEPIFVSPFMVNVAPPRFVRNASPGAPIGQALLAAFEAGRGALPHPFRQLLARLGGSS
jgi:hypothetical protein